MMTRVIVHSLGPATPIVTRRFANTVVQIGREHVARAPPCLLENVAIYLVVNTVAPIQRDHAAIVLMYLAERFATYRFVNTVART